MWQKPFFETAVTPATVAPRGTILRCSAGHEMAEVTADIREGAWGWHALVGNWRAEAPVPGSIWPLCHHCGAPLVVPGVNRVDGNARRSGGFAA